MRKFLVILALALTLWPKLGATWPSETGTGVVSANETIVRTSLEATQVLQSDTLTNLYGTTILGGTTNYASFDSGGVFSARNVVSSRDVITLSYDQFIQWRKSDGTMVRLGTSADDVFVTPIGITATSNDLVFTATTSDATLTINGHEGFSSRLLLCADQCDDLADMWEFDSQAGGNQVLALKNWATGGIKDAFVFYSTGTIGMINGQYVKNPSAGLVQVGGSTNNETLEVITSGTTNQTAAIQLTADNGGDAGDRWQILNDSASAALSFRNDIGGSQAQVLGLNSSGVFFMADGMQFSNYSGSNEALMAFSHDAGALRIQAAASNNAYLNLEANASTGSGNDWRITNDAPTKSLIIGNDHSGGQVSKVTINENGTVSGSNVDISSIFTTSINTTDIRVSGNLTRTSSYVTGSCTFTFNNGLLTNGVC